MLQAYSFNERKMVDIVEITEVKQFKTKNKKIVTILFGKSKKNENLSRIISNCDTHKK